MKKVKRIIGILMIVALFGTIYGFCAYQNGIVAASMYFGSTILLVGFLFLAIKLIDPN